MYSVGQKFSDTSRIRETHVMLRIGLRAQSAVYFTAVANIYLRAAHVQSGVQFRTCCVSNIMSKLLLHNETN